MSAARRGMRLAWNRRMSATISFILPVHNAADTIDDALDAVVRADLGHPDMRREIIVVDDASTDGTTDQLRRIAARGLARVTGDIVVVADAALAYDPTEAGRLLAPILAGSADVVYGSRYVATSRQVPRLWDRLSDQILTA